MIAGLPVSAKMLAGLATFAKLTLRSGAFVVYGIAGSGGSTVTILHVSFFLLDKYSASITTKAAIAIAAMVTAAMQPPDHLLPPICGSGRILIFRADMKWLSFEKKLDLMFTYTEYKKRKSDTT